jgi:hypothetical protein
MGPIRKNASIALLRWPTHFQGCQACQPSGRTALETTKSTGREVSPTLTALADEVIE